MKNVLWIFGIVLLTIGIFSCKGPEGPAGPMGVQGVQGIQGPEGNANVFADTLTLISSDWLWAATYWFQYNDCCATGTASRYYDIEIPAITEDILFEGEVRIFMEHLNSFEDSTWSSLPITFINNYFTIYTYQVSEEQIRLYFFHSKNDPSATLPDLSTFEIPTRLFKWVVIEGNLVSQMNNSNVDLNNYNQIEAYYKERGIKLEKGILEY